MPHAEIRIRREPYYRLDSITAGMRRLGYEIVSRAPAAPGNVLVLWNRKAGRDDADATAMERAGGKVLVIENGYIQKVDKSMYAVSLSEHHTGGPVGDTDRFSALGFELQPMRPVLHVGVTLVCGQRGIGSPHMASPPQWAEKKAAELRRYSEVVRVRPHPGNTAPRVPLQDDLRDVDCVHVWSSNAGVLALVLGYSVTSWAPHWICQDWFTRGRKAALQLMAWSQWSPAEIATGEPFARLLQC